MVYFVTGGSGFLGRAIVNELLADWDGSIIHELRVLDIKMPVGSWTENVTFIQGDIRDRSIVNKACKGVDVVIHSAAIVDWGTKSEQEVLSINFGGTENIVQACLDNKVPYLIYTSSLDAVFNGKSLKNIDETVPYPAKPVNAYCDSKYRAEVLVKESNSESLKTCILRPADIYGEGDPYHIGSLINMAKDGFYVRLGDGKSVCQHVYVRNMAYAHVLATKALIDHKPDVPGNIYFITDGPGKNFFKFYDQVVTGSGYKIWPKNLWLPYWLAFSIGSSVEFLSWLISPVKKINPKFSRFAVVYTCSDFTFSAEKARRDLGYIPKYAEQEAIEKTIAFYKKEREE